MAQLMREILLSMIENIYSMILYQQIQDQDHEHLNNVFFFK